MLFWFLTALPRLLIFTHAAYPHLVFNCDFCYFSLKESRLKLRTFQWFSRVPQPKFKGIRLGVYQLLSDIQRSKQGLLLCIDIPISLSAPPPPLSPPSKLIHAKVKITSKWRNIIKFVYHLQHLYSLSFCHFDVHFWIKPPFPLLLLLRSIIFIFNSN